MNSRLPPIPEDNRSHKGPGETAKAKAEDAHGAASDPGTKNFDQQGRQGNIKVNTTHQGYQQDR